ncbi:hypothetical protein HLV39_02990 [Marinobacter adhaerens]|uniref:DUF6160 domain-containing protein n=1 Tax=Marinobacter adhaerens TaxID=1033846 RepID=A0A851HU30_9GAMM|nr:DUF6160 family protein [Marinobacter adhaerens]NWN90465.1 hypothetical protein [Marinobacter adhaerens]
MKSLKEIALTTAIVAAPFTAQAGMKILDDSIMGGITGQAGVTIEMETRVDIGKLTYTDAGSFSVSGITLGGAGITTAGAVAGYDTLLNELKVNIDINDVGDSVVRVGSMATQNLSAWGGSPEVPAPIDWGLNAKTMALTSQGGSQSTILLSDLGGYGNLSQLDIVVHNDGVGSLQLGVGFNVVDMKFNVDFLGIGIKGMSLMGIDYIEAIAAQPEVEDMLSTTSFASASLNVYKGDSLGSSEAEGILRVDVSDVSMDLVINDVIIGGSNDDVASRSIGSIALDNLVISETRLAVYGH